MRRTFTTVFVTLGAAVFILAPWLVDDYTLGTVSRMLSLGLLAVSVAVLTGWAGLPTLGQTAPYAVGAYAAATLARNGFTVGPVQIVVAALAAAAFSAVVGVAVVRTRGVVFLMATLAVGELAAAAAARWKAVTGGTDGLAAIPAAQPFWGLEPMIEDSLVYAYVLATAAIVTVVVVLALRYSRAGLLLTASRDNEPRMRASGHPVAGYLYGAYVLAGAIAGVGGALLVTGQRYISPQDIGFEISALVLLAVTIAGTRSLTGAIAAVAVVVAVREWAAATVPGHGPLLLGLLFIASVYLLANGRLTWVRIGLGRAGIGRVKSVLGKAGPV
ncbi:MAG TPA: branched-chain amino acid ABC transporter permease [Candidatus Limnocylindrales bacterium]|nr:branched-chain amino acid ABC transporter permease [Candidatus Limnocylindrales bacterium]